VNAFHISALNLPVNTAFLTVALIAGTHGAMAQAQTPGPPGGSGSAPVSPAVGPPGAEASPADTLSTIVVTGTSIHTDSAAYQSAPVSVITSEAIQQSGATNIEQYFQTQPAFVLSGQSSYSNTGSSTGADGTSIGGTTLNLRGIGPQYTLILVNGRRFQSEDPANLDLIPLDAIDRVEILKSGASAIYGSDAVAGVVNIITKKTADGLSLDGQWFRQTHGRLLSRLPLA
jgi:iron complex outermembrane receptor protein